MNDTCTSKFPSRIDKLLIQDPSPRQLKRIWEHISFCESCRARYNRVLVASRLFEGGPKALDMPTDRELCWIEHGVMHRTRLVPDTGFARSYVRWLAGAALTIAALLLIIPLALKAPPSPSGFLRPSDSEFTARGGTTMKESTKVGLRAFCIVEQAGGPNVNGIAPAARENLPAGSCPLSGILRFAYTNRSPLKFLFLIGVDESYDLKWYLPHPPAVSSIEVAPNSVDKPLKRAVQLSVNHVQGQLRIYAVFSQEPLHISQVKRAIVKIRRAQRGLSEVPILPLKKTEQRSLLLRLTS